MYPGLFGNGVFYFSDKRNFAYDLGKVLSCRCEYTDGGLNGVLVVGDENMDKSRDRALGDRGRAKCREAALVDARRHQLTLVKLKNDPKARD